MSALKYEPSRFKWTKNWRLERKINAIINPTKKYSEQKNQAVMSTGRTVRLEIIAADINTAFSSIQSNFSHDNYFRFTLKHTAKLNKNWKLNKFKGETNSETASGRLLVI